MASSDADECRRLGLATGVIPGGPYARVRLRGEAPAIYGRIGPTFDALSDVLEPDETRPWLEFYRREGEIDVLVPLTQSG